MPKFVECVPNFSEGRDEKKIEAIVSAIRSASATILDIEKDSDHNRSVITFVAEVEAALEASFRAAQKALELIDLNRHKGEHPRMGAVDVIPFIPIGETPMEDCIHLARRLGEKIGGELQIPVFLYDHAAARPERKDLAYVRKGQFEGLREEIGRNPDRTPDFGPNRIHPTAGAVAIGAREQIINFNINLRTRDLDLAKAIAKKIRTSGGGLPFLRAKEIELKEKRMVQVSTVLTCYQKTSLHAVFQTVEREAGFHGTEIVSSEIVGLVPLQALLNFSVERLQLENFKPEIQILEKRLEVPSSSSRTPSWTEAAHRVIEAVRFPSATPGGGSVSALAGSLACALGQMVCGIHLAKSQSRDLKRLREELEALGTDLENCAGKDAEVFDQVMAAFKKPKLDPDRSQAIQSNLKKAAEVPLRTAALSLQVLERLGTLEPLADPGTLSDLRTARYLAQAAIQGALENVRINLSSIKDPAYVQSLQRQAEEILHACR